MEGPSFYCAYLGFSPLSKPPTNLSVLQNPVRDLYFKYRKTPASGRSASLKLTQQGVVVVLYEDGVIKAELFFEFSSVTFVEAAKFLPVKSSSERKPKAMFVPVDESKGPASDKNAFQVEKNFHFLVSSTHPPLVVCVVRRPTGVKALDCHLFALDTIENALHITNLIGSTQMPAGPMMRTDVGADLARGKGNFDRGIRGDVIRTEHGEYSVYRGAQAYEPPQTQRYSAGSGITARTGNGNMAPAAGPFSGPIMLTQDNFRDLPSPSQPQYDDAPGPGGYRMYEQSNVSGSTGNAYLRQPDVIMHTRQRSGDSTDNTALDRSFSGSDHSGGGGRGRYDEVNLRNTNRSSSGSGPINRLSGGAISGNRLSSGQGPPSGKISPRPQDLPTSQGLGPGSQFSPWQAEPASSPVSPMAGINSPRSPPVFSPTSPRGFDSRDSGGPVFSASNLESRKKPEDEPEEATMGGRPVAKVPPHMKAGIKVLPSDFKMVKLKPKVEKRSDDYEEPPGYDNHKDMMQKYKQLQESERANKQSDESKHSSSHINNYPDGDSFREFSNTNVARGRDEHRADFMSEWNESVREYRGQKGGNRDYMQGPEDNNNKHVSSRSGSRLDERQGSGWAGDAAAQDEARTKDLEMADMFSNFDLQGGNNSGNMYPPVRDRNEIEEGLGYLP